LDGVAVRYAKGPPWRRVTVDAVRDVTLAIGEAETLGLVGESGSGKTTIGRVMLGLVRPTRGEVRLEGGRLARRSPGSMQVVLQNPDQSLNPRHTISRSLIEPLTVAGEVERRARRRRALEMLELVGLPASYADRHPAELSGGQRQRVAIARALITDPALIVFDEAVTALDVSVQAQIVNLIADLQQTLRFAALFISHDLAVVRYVASRIAVMYTGEIVETGPAVNFYGHELHPYSIALAAAASLAPHEHDSNPGDADIAADGCPFRHRCPRADEACVVAPQLRDIGGIEVACHHLGAGVPSITHR
jgi:ABC-type glutathione transport system ATPase component